MIPNDEMDSIFKININDYIDEHVISITPALICERHFLTLAVAN